MPPAQHRHRKSFPLIALNLAIVLVVGGGTAAYGALSRTVTLTVDGRTDTIRTFGDTVDDLLDAKGVLVRSGDRVSHPRDEVLDDGDQVDVAYAKPLELTVDGVTSRRTVFEATVGGALARLGVEPTPSTYLSTASKTRIPRDGLDIVVSHTKALTVVADGEKAPVSTSAATVAGVLDAAGVTLDGDDEVKPALDDFIRPDQTVRVVRIEKVTRAENVSVKFPVEIRDDPGAFKGETSLLTVGKKGKNREQVTLILADGKVRERLVLGTEVLSKPVTQIESRGTKALPSVWDRLAQCESGGNWQTNTGNGFYGGVQFSASTWRGVGGTGLPHQNSREEQIKRAMILQQRSGWGQWPGCARKLGLL